MHYYIYKPYKHGNLERKTSMEFKVDIMGRINNTNLPDSKYLWAVLESIVNSIQSIEEANILNGRIEIYAQRNNIAQITFDTKETRERNFEYKSELSAFDSFAVTDNGRGFTSENYKSFLTADSSLKWKKGCKGIGRFLWLKAFENAKIESTFFEDNIWKKRIFDFTVTGITPDENLLTTDKQERKTTVTLTGYKSHYRDKCPKSIETLARKIIEHCLIYFLLNKCPKIVIIDSLGESIDLNQYYETKIRESLHQDQFNIQDNNFVIYHVKMPEGTTAHELHLCANDREVRSIRLEKFFPNLQKKISDGIETGFFYCGYLTGLYLDKTVNTARTSFDFSDEQQIEIENNVTEQTLIDAAKESISTYLQEYIELINMKKKKRISEFVAHKQPQYRLLLNQRPEVVDKIKPELSDGELELVLHSEVLAWDMDAKQRGQDIRKNMAKNGVTSEQVIPRFNDYCKEITAISRISLSEYIIRRKVILELLETALERKDDGTYVNESQIHSIVCPMRYTSDEVNFEEMNLWIIDERLAYHSFLASDKQMRELPQLDSQSKDRMDIAIFDEAFSFSDNPFNSITIIEFKRPNRGGLNKESSDPIRQVLRYVEQIKEGKQKKANGRPFGQVQNTAFYCYVIADLTESMMESAKGSNLHTTPDGEGFFGFNQNYGAYIEVISYDKLLKDAKERNQILFDKLFKASPREIISGDQG
jgi:hypothetical protein